jgi:hypothetical protein
MAALSLVVFQEKADSIRAGVRFSLRKCHTAKMPERFCFPPM